MSNQGNVEMKLPSGAGTEVAIIQSIELALRLTFATLQRANEPTNLQMGFPPAASFSACQHRSWCRVSGNGEHFISSRCVVSSAARISDFFAFRERALITNSRFSARLWLAWTS